MSDTIRLLKALVADGDLAAAQVLRQEAKRNHDSVLMAYLRTVSTQQTTELRKQAQDWEALTGLNMYMVLVTMPSTKAHASLKLDCVRYIRRAAGLGLRECLNLVEDVQAGRPRCFLRDVPTDTATRLIKEAHQLGHDVVVDWLSAESIPVSYRPEDAPIFSTPLKEHLS